MYIVMFIGILFWLYYGIIIKSFAIITANVVSGVLVLFVLLFKFFYESRNS